MQRNHTSTARQGRQVLGYCNIPKPCISNSCKKRPASGSCLGQAGAGGAASWIERPNPGLCVRRFGHQSVRGSNEGAWACKSTCAQQSRSQSRLTRPNPHCFDRVKASAHALGHSLFWIRLTRADVVLNRVLQRAQVNLAHTAFTTIMASWFCGVAASCCYSFPASRQDAVLKQA